MKRAPETASPARRPAASNTGPPFNSMPVRHAFEPASGLPRKPERSTGQAGAASAFGYSTAKPAVPGEYPVRQLDDRGGRRLLDEQHREVEIFECAQQRGGGDRAEAVAYPQPLRAEQAGRRRERGAAVADQDAARGGACAVRQNGGARTSGREARRVAGLLWQHARRETREVADLEQLRVERGALARVGMRARGVRGEGEGAPVLARLHVGARQPDLRVGGVLHEACALEQQCRLRRVAERERLLAGGEQLLARENRLLRREMARGEEAGKEKRSSRD